MSRFILAVRSGHNASAVIGEGGRILFGIQEERLNGEKNYWGFPKQAIHHCLKAVGARPADVLSVACGEHAILSRYHSRDDVLKSYRRHTEPLGKLRQRLLMPFVLRASPNWGQKGFEELLRAEGLGDAPVSYFDHHASHATTAYYGLRQDPNEEILVLSCDGSGDNLCATVRVMGGGKQRVLAETDWEHSLGAIYAWVTFAMGFLPMEHEYKLMGMAPYVGETAAAEAAKMFHAYLGLDETGLKFKRKISEPVTSIADRLFRDMKGRRFDTICAGLQRFTEELLADWTKNAVKASGVRKVVGAGGVFMNVKANKRIAELAEVESFEAFPSCGDETLPFGAFYQEVARRFGDAEVKPLEHFYLGDELDSAACEEAIARFGYKAEKPADMAKAVADILVQGHPLARVHGRMEFGARALCNRSILADARNGDAVRVINQMVKKRDFWMPFAPVMLERRADDYLHNPKRLKSPYMMMTFDTKDNFRDLIAAVHNADLTCRAQILRPGQNPGMEAILEAFEKQTGRGVLLNTSYNLHGFPIVRTPDEALGVFKNSGLEFMQLGDHLVFKRPRG